jgi:hypothetical protein
MERPTLRRLLSRTALPLAAFFAIAAWSLTQTAEARAETLYLARSALVLLLAAAWVAPPSLRFARAHAAGAILVVVAVWALPAGPREGPHRGLAVTAMLLALLTVAVAGSVNGRWRWTAVLPLAVALQSLLVPDVLLPGQEWPRQLLLLVGLPLVSALAVARLGRHLGTRKALLAGGLAAAWTPGFDLGTTLLLVALAAAADLRWGERTQGWRVIPIALLVAPLLGSPRAGLLALAASAFAAPRLWPRILAPAALCLLALAFPARELSEAFTLLPWLILALPVILAPSREDLSVRGASLLLGLAGVVLSPHPGWMVPAVAFLVLSSRNHIPSATVQATWGVVMVGGAAFFASYPWLRTPPMPHFFHALGMQATWFWAMVVTVMAGLLVLGQSLLPQSRSRTSSLAGSAAVALALFASVPQAGIALLPASTLLGGAEGLRRWTSERVEATATAIMVESSLGHTAHLDSGTTVATLTLETGSGTLLRLPLRLGRETDEWSSRHLPRDMTAALAPSTFFGWVDSSGLFFGLRYRTVLDLPVGATTPIVQVRLELAPSLPELTLGLFKMELRP